MSSPEISQKFPSIIDKNPFIKSDLLGEEISSGLFEGKKAIISKPSINLASKPRVKTVTRSVNEPLKEKGTFFLTATEEDFEDEYVPKPVKFSQSPLGKSRFFNLKLF